MSPLNLAGIALALLAVLLLLCFDLTDGWFFGLLCLACLSGSMGEAYRDNKPGAIVWLAVAGLFAVASLRAAYLDSRQRRGGD
jgi:xanthine/uracil/vitamin C permease (AzgA family)